MNKVKQNKKYVSFGLLCVAFIFLCNPNIAVIDLLPDFIGYIILSFALVNLADINETVAEALKGFRRMIFIDAGKMLSLVWIFGISVTTEKNSSLLLWSFAFCVLELIMAIPAFIKLFKGLLELGYLNENVAIIGAKGKKRNPTDKIKNLTVFFVAIKAILAFLPELADLTSTEYYENQGMTNLYRYIGIMRFLAFVPVLVVGLYWVIRCAVYFIRVTRDKPFMDAINTYYRENVLPKSGIFIKRSVNTALVILTVALILSADIRIEHVNFFPDIISAVLFVVFFVFSTKKFGTRSVLPVTLSVCYAITSILSTVLEARFFGEYSFSSIYRDAAAYSSYTVLTVVSIINVFFFVTVAALSVFVLKKIIKEHTGVLVGDSRVNGEAKKSMTQAIHKEMNKILALCLGSIAVYTVTDIAYALLIKSYGIMTLIGFVGAALCVAAFIKAYFEITEAVESKYLLE